MKAHTTAANAYQEDRIEYSRTGRVLKSGEPITEYDVVIYAAGRVLAGAGVRIYNAEDYEPTAAHVTIPAWDDVPAFDQAHSPGVQSHDYCGLGHPSSAGRTLAYGFDIADQLEILERRLPDYIEQTAARIGVQGLTGYAERASFLEIEQ